MSVKTLLIVYHSLTDGTRQMAEAARAGAAAEGEVAVRLLHQGVGLNALDALGVDGAGATASIATSGSGTLAGQRTEFRQKRVRGTVTFRYGVYGYLAQK